MDRGYVRLWRKSLDSQAWVAGPEVWQVWCWCLMRANYLQRWVQIRVGRAKVAVELSPGQFVTGRHAMGTELKMKPNTAWKRLKRLEKMQNVDIQSSRQYSVVTICHWELYQDDDQEKGQQKGQPRGNRGATEGQPRGTDKKDKKGKKEEKKEDALFDAFWAVVHLKVGKQAAKKEFRLAIARLRREPLSHHGSADPGAWLVQRMRVFAASPAARPTDHTPVHPERWLSKGRYDDDPETWQEKGARHGSGAAQEGGRIHDEDWSQIRTRRAAPTTTG